MRTKKPLTKVNCRDWHETWGMGTNKIGKLSIEIVSDCPIKWEHSTAGNYSRGC